MKYDRYFTYACSEHGVGIIDLSWFDYYLLLLWKRVFETMVCTGIFWLNYRCEKEKRDSEIYTKKPAVVFGILLVWLCGGRNFEFLRQVSRISQGRNGWWTDDLYIRVWGFPFFKITFFFHPRETMLEILRNYGECRCYSFYVTSQFCKWPVSQREAIYSTVRFNIFDIPSKGNARRTIFFTSFPWLTLTTLGSWALLMVLKRVSKVEMNATGTVW